MNNITFLLSIGLSLLLLLIFQAEGNAQDTQSNDDSSYRIVAYAGGSTNMWAIEASKITHINYAVANVNEEGEIFFRNPVEAGQQLARLQKLKAKNPELKLLVSVGGWGADGFSDAALTKESRDDFAESAVKMIKNYGLDGIDLDWEFPGQPGPGITYRAEDKQHFTLMLKSLRRQLDSLSHKRGLTGDDRYLLTIASNDNQAFFEHTQMGLLHQYLDFINVMAYDMFTVGSETTGHHTGLYQSSPDDPARTTAAAVQRHLDAGIPAQKIVVGVAFYGRSWQGVVPQRHGLYQPFEKFYRFIQYEELTDHYINKNGFKRYWDEAAKAPYLWSADQKIMISYDDPESLRHKANYIKENNLGGVMYW